MQETTTQRAASWGIGWPRLLIGAGVVAITLLHYLTGLHFLPYHSIYRSLYYLPIAGAAVLGGLRGGLLVSAVISALYLPHVMMLGQELPGGLFDNLLEIVAFNFVAVLAGWLADTQRRQRHELAVLRGYLDAILASLPVGVATVAPSGEIAARNPAAQQLIENLGELLRLPVSSGYAEMSLHRRTLGIRRSPLHDPSGAAQGDVLVLEDLSEERELQERVRQAERLAALGRLAGGLAHEVRNPLAILRATAQLLAAKLAHEAGIRRYTEVLTGEADRIDRLIGALLSYASPPPPTLAAVAVQPLLHDLATACESYAAQHSVTITVDVPEQLPDVVADREQLRQALLNLILNAIQASPTGESVTLSAWGSGARVCFTLRDHGAGIPADARSRVFDPFFTTRDEGTGMGLAVVARIVADHDGTVALENAVDGGAVARLCLPVAADQPGQVTGHSTKDRQEASWPSTS